MDTGNYEQSSTSTVKKRRARSGTQRKWTNEEVVHVLDYLVETIRSGREIEKPTASAYYAGIIQKLGLHEVTTEKLRAQVSHLKSTYVRAVNWRGNTGQGVHESEGPEAVKSYMLKISPHFDVLEEIFGFRASINPPFVSDSGVITENVVYEVELDSEPGTLPESLSPSTSGHSSGLEPCKLQPQFSERRIGKRKMVAKDSITLLAESQLKRSMVLEKQLEAREKHFAQELEMRNRELHLNEKRLETERELKLLEFEQNERIARYKIDQECQLQLRLANLKSDLNSQNIL